MGSCFECDATSDIHEHHVVPQSLGGERTVLLCSECHRLVHGVRKITTSALTKAALRVKKARGERTGGIPFGYDVASDGKTLVENEVEQRTASIVVAMREEGFSLRRIASQLNTDRVPCRGSEWHLTTIVRILSAKR